MKLGKKIFVTVIIMLCIFAVCSSCASNSDSPNDEWESRDNLLAGEVSPKKSNSDETNYDDYDLVILRYYSAAPTDEVAEKLTEELGWKIKIITYDTDDYYKLNTKLMAGDDDFDLYIDSSSDFSKYMLGGFYTDLKQFEGLNERLSSNRLVDFAADYNGEYIGLPIILRYNEEMFFDYQSPTILDYCAKNVDTLERRFSDPDGEKFFEVLRYVYDNDGDVKDNAKEYVDFSVVQSSYCIMSPHSKHKEAAVLFLERMFDTIASMPDDFDSVPYPDVGDTDLSNAYLTWKFMGAEVRAPIIDAYEAALESDGKDSTLKKLAKEAAAEVAMRVGE